MVELCHNRLPIELGLRPSRVAEIRVDQGQRLAHAGMRTRAALIASYCREPGGRLAHLPTREHGFVCGHERRLRGVVGVVRVTQESPAQAVHHAAVLLEELGGPRAGDPQLRVAGLPNGVSDQAQCP
jgi:hypothetical protein